MLKLKSKNGEETKGIVMRKLFCLIICLLIVFLTCACGKGTVSQVSEPVSQTVTSEESMTSSMEESAVSEPVSVAPPSSAPVSSTAPVVSKVEAPPKKEDIKVTLPKFTYTVTDAHNARGLSTKKNGFSFGVAKNGVPHNQSVTNQKNFDSYNNVKALALDTKTQEKVMYLTFDNGYQYQNLTADILDTLKEKKVKASFFILLSYAKQNPQLVRRMIDEGHIVGNHSVSHPSFPTISRTKMAEEIGTLENYMREKFSYATTYFRFPSGEYSECALELVTSIGFKSIFWSGAYADWDTSAQKGADYAFDTVTARFHPGAVILLHAVSKDNADALGRIIDEAHRQGYTFKSLDDYTF